jgi:hypothetical protein
MNYTVEMGSVAMIYTPSSIKIGSVIQNSHDCMTPHTSKLVTPTRVEVHKYFPVFFRLWDQE